jgi:hypothetical protein
MKVKRNPKKMTRTINTDALACSTKPRLFAIRRTEERRRVLVRLLPELRLDFWRKYRRSLCIDTC